MKMILSTLLITIFITPAFAKTSIQAVQIPYDTVQQVIENSIGVHNTCMDDYLKRDKQLSKFLIWAPPSAVLAVPASFFIGGFTAAALTAGRSGWDALGWVIFGAFGAATITTATFATLQISKGIEFIRVRKMNYLINAAHNQHYNSKTLKKFVKRYNKKYPKDGLSIEQIAAMIVELDQKEMLCNNEVRKRKRVRKLKHRLAYRKHVMKYIHKNL